MSKLADEILEHLKTEWPEAYEKWLQERNELAAERERRAELFFENASLRLEVADERERVAKLRAALEKAYLEVEYENEREAIEAVLSETGDTDGLP